MKKTFLVILTCVVVIFYINPLFSQTFTSNGTCVPMDVNNLSCWDVSDECEEGNNNFQTFEQLINTSSLCPIDIILNQPYIYEGSLTFGGSFKKLTITGNGSLTITGDLIIDKEQEVNISLENQGELNIRGILEISAGKSGSETVLNIDGDGTSIVSAEEIDLNGNARLNILSGGGLVSRTETRYNGNSSEINVYGLFITHAITIQGGKNHQLNAYGNGKIGVQENVTLAGDAHIAFGGSSEVEIGGELSVKGNAVLEVTETSSVKVCKGELPKVQGETYDETGKKTGVFVEEPSNYEQSCEFNILPVNYIYIEAAWDTNERTSTLSWATSKEWENSHFEIERSMDGTATFETIGQVSGRGWTDEITEYEFEDQDLPLAGGNYFYRLKQVDFNGVYDYSEIVAVRVPNIHITKGVWRGYPNPTIGSDFNLDLADINQYSDEPVKMRIYSSHISSAEMVFNSLQDLSQTAGNMMANASAGLWIFEIQWGNKVERIKVMKQ